MIGALRRTALGPQETIPGYATGSGFWGAAIVAERATANELCSLSLTVARQFGMRECRRSCAWSPPWNSIVSRCGRQRPGEGGAPGAIREGVATEHGMHLRTERGDVVWDHDLAGDAIIGERI